VNQDDTNTRKRKFPVRNGNGSESGKEVTKTWNFFYLNPGDGNLNGNFAFSEIFFLNTKFTEKTEIIQKDFVRLFLNIIGNNCMFINTQ